MPKNSISVDELAAVVRTQLGSKLPADAPLGPDATLESLGLASLDVTEVFFAIEELVGGELDPVPAADAETLGALVDVVNAQLGALTAQLGAPTAQLGAPTAQLGAPTEVLAEPVAEWMA
jgi:acyl carrier protein